MLEQSAVLLHVGRPPEDSTRQQQQQQQQQQDTAAAAQWSSPAHGPGSRLDPAHAPPQQQQQQQQQQQRQQHRSEAGTGAGLDSVTAAPCASATSPDAATVVPDLGLQPPQGGGGLGGGDGGASTAVGAAGEVLGGAGAGAREDDGRGAALHQRVAALPSVTHWDSEAMGQARRLLRQQGHVSVAHACGCGCGCGCDANQQRGHSSVRSCVVQEALLRTAAQT